MEDATSLSMALLLEMKQWYMNLGPERAPSRSFTGITRGGMQFITNLSPLQLEANDRLSLLGWIFRQEDVAAYAYATHLGVMTESGDVAEEIGIYSSDGQSKASTALAYVEDPNGIGRFVPQKIYSDLKTWTPFHDLHTVSLDLSLDKIDGFREIWKMLSERSMWRERS